MSTRPLHCLAMVLLLASASFAQISFGPALTIPMGMAGGAGPQKVVTGDLDGDFVDDIVFTHDGTGQVGVILSGAFFQSVDSFAAGSTPRGIAVVDVDGDKDLDLVIANESADGLTVLLNGGNGSFSAGNTIVCGTGAAPTSIAAADFNNDGMNDLAVNHSGLGTVGIYLNAGAGTFAAPVTYVTGTTPSALAAGDMDGDTDADIVVIDSTNDDWKILTNSGTGIFAVGSSNPALNSFPEVVKLVDTDGDDDLDVVIGNFIPATLSIFSNLGGGNFGFAATSAGVHLVDIAHGDFDADGLDEIVGCDFAFNLIQTFDNMSGSIVPDAPIAPATGEVPMAIATGDFDGDHHDDLVYINSGANTVVLRVNNETAPRLSDDFANGNVGLATLAAPEKVITVNGSDGGDFHVVHIAPNNLGTIVVQQPSTNPFTSFFALWGIVDIPNRRLSYELPNNIGTMVLPPQVADLANANLFTISNSLFADPLQFAGNLGATWFVEFFAGPFPGRVTIQGLIIDTPTSFAVTNAIIIDVH